MYIFILIAFPFDIELDFEIEFFFETNLITKYFPAYLWKEAMWGKRKQNWRENLKMGSNAENEEVCFLCFFKTKDLIFLPMYYYAVFDNCTR